MDHWNLHTSGYQPIVTSAAYQVSLNAERLTMRQVLICAVYQISPMSKQRTDCSQGQQAPSQWTRLMPFPSPLALAIDIARTPCLKR